MQNGWCLCQWQWPPTNGMFLSIINFLAEFRLPTLSYSPILSHGSGFPNSEACKWTCSSWSFELIFNWYIYIYILYNIMIYRFRFISNVVFLIFPLIAGLAKCQSPRWGRGKSPATIGEIRRMLRSTLRSHSSIAKKKNPCSGKHSWQNPKRDEREPVR